MFFLGYWIRKSRGMELRMTHPQQREPIKIDITKHAVLYVFYCFCTSSINTLLFFQIHRCQKIYIWFKLGDEL